MTGLTRARLDPEWHAARADLVRYDLDEAPSETFTRRVLAALRLLHIEDDTGQAVPDASA